MGYLKKRVGRANDPCYMDNEIDDSPKVPVQDLHDSLLKDYIQTKERDRRRGELLAEIRGIVLRDMEMHEEGTRRRHWTFTDFFLKLACVLGLYIGLIWACGPGREPPRVQRVVALSNSLASAAWALVDPAVPANRLRYNTVAFHLEYVYFLEQIPEPGTECARYYVLEPHRAALEEIEWYSMVEECPEDEQPDPIAEEGAGETENLLFRVPVMALTALMVVLTNL